MAADSQRLAHHTDLDDCQEEVDNLRRRVDSQPVIEQAKGILMAAEHCSPDRAFDMLSRASQNRNEKLRDLAATIVDHTQRTTPGTDVTAIDPEAAPA